MNENASKEKPKCALIGEDGNIFNLMGKASRTLKRNGMRKKETIVRTDNPKEHIFTDRNNRTVIITDLGQLVYETCMGAGQYIMMYRVQKEEEPGSGKYSSNIVYTNILIYTDINAKKSNLNLIYTILIVYLQYVKLLI